MDICKLPHANCSICSLVTEQVVPPTKIGNPEVVFVGEAPGALEVVEGSPFVGPSGQLLRSTYKAAGGDPDKAYYTNVVMCKPPSNREPTSHEIACCLPRLKAELEDMDVPVVALGRTAQFVLGASTEDNGRWANGVLPTWHPAYVLRNVDEASTFLRDMRAVVRGPKMLGATNTEVVAPQSLSELESLLSSLSKGTWVSVDIETDQVNWYDSNNNHKDPILMMQLCWDTSAAVVLDDVMLYDTPGVPELLQKVLSDCKIIGHNFKFDSVFLASHINLRLNVDFDTFLAHYILDENLPHGLKEIAKTELGMPDYEKDLITQYLKTRNDKYSKIPFDKLAKYGALDVANTLILKDRLELSLAQQEMLGWPMQNLMIPISHVLRDVELRGFRVDKDSIARAYDSFQQDIDGMTSELRLMCETPDLNVDSPAQLANVIYGYYNFPEQNHWKIKPRSTAHDAIEKFKGHPFVDKLLAYRRVAKMQRSYAKNILDYMEVGTDRVHADFKIHGTEVGRISVADPALQTIPRPSEYYGALIRSLFIPQEGYKLVIADYSQAELRVLAALSQESFLIDVYEHDRDLHTEVAIAMYGPNYTKEQRVMCKMFNFSYAYGGTEKSFAEDAGLNIQVAREFVKNYNNNMPKALRWKASQFQQMQDKGEVTTIFGRKRRFPLITAQNFDDARKASVHMPVASTANDLTLISAVRLWQQNIPIVLTVHDSIIAEVPEKDALEVATLMEETMRRVGEEFLPQVKWKADAEIKDRWAAVPERIK